MSPKEAMWEDYEQMLQFLISIFEDKDQLKGGVMSGLTGRVRGIGEESI